jgi:hypothetical protein
MNDKEICDIKLFMKNMKLKKVNEDSLYFYYNKHILTNMRILVDDIENVIYDKNEIKLYEKRKSIINHYIETLGFSLTNDICLDEKKYKENVLRLLNDDMYKNQDKMSFNILFGMERRHKMISNISNGIKPFNRSINCLFSDFGFIIKQIRCGKRKDILKYGLEYIKNVNELFNKINNKFKMFEPKLNIYEFLSEKVNKFNFDE